VLIGIHELLDRIVGDPQVGAPAPNPAAQQVLL
jgi:hypothetical protein